MPKYQNLEYNRVPFRINRIVPEYLANDMEMTIRTMGERMVMELDGYVAARIVQSKQITATAKAEAYASFDIPKTWWQHFKFDVIQHLPFGGWFLRKFPIKWITKSDKQTATNTVTETFEIRECDPDIIMRPDQNSAYIAVFGPDNEETISCRR